jgi:hypothetical protein
MATVFKIEEGKLQNTKCKCCNKRSINIHGFVYKNGDAFAVYRASWADAHDKNQIKGVVSIGDWDETASSKDRVTIGIKMWADEKSVNTSVLDPEESPWRETEMLGKVLKRSEALKLTNIGEYYAVIDAITEQDKRIVKYFDLK